MANPATFTIDRGNAGICISYTRRRRALYVSAWYDSIVGMEGHELSLTELARALRIPPSHLRSAADEMEEELKTVGN